MHASQFEEMENRLEELVESCLAQSDVQLVSVQVERRGKRMVVTVCLDREGGIDVETCAEMSELIGRHLDVERIIKGSYSLEVESPGLQRVLRKPREFRHFLGREVEILLRQSFEGRQKMQGRLLSADEQGMTLLVEDEEITFPYQALKRTRLHSVLPW